MQQTFRYASKGLRLCHFMLFVAGGLAISGGVNSSPTNSPDSMGTGHALRKSSAILLLFVFIILVAVTAGILARINQTWVGDRLIIYAVTAIFPFLLVRVIYTLVYSFDTDSAAFNPEDPNVYIQAFMVSQSIDVYRLNCYEAKADSRISKSPWSVS